MAIPLQKRRLRDLAEMQDDPYPNIKLHPNDDLTGACLILSPEGQDSLHLTMVLNDFPLSAPRVTIQSEISHPNVFGSYICASILNTAEGYTPAYTLKIIAIQLLSVFSSKTLDQDGNGQKMDLGQYRERRSSIRGSYHCVACGFDDDVRNGEKQARRLGEYFRSVAVAASGQGRKRVLSRQNFDDTSGTGGRQVKIPKLKGAEHKGLDETPNAIIPANECAPFTVGPTQKIMALPDEILLKVFSDLPDKDLWALANVCPVINEILYSYDCIRLRELQCFYSKESFMIVKLGIGVHIRRKGCEGTFESEFDLLSQKAFRDYGIRRSVQGLDFEHWMPLPLSRRHWRSVRADVSSSLEQLADAASLQEVSDVNVIYHFMNDIVVKFSQAAEECFRASPESSLNHASEKAVGSYFALFHLLLCLATENSAITHAADAKIHSFLDGQTSKSSCPDLGHLLVATLVSNVGLTEQLRLAIIKEAILRNVVWMLDPIGAGMPELAYLEPSPISEYRLRNTFQASRTSYRLLMLLALFCQTARGQAPLGQAPSLASLCDAIFAFHGATPPGITEYMAGEIRRIKYIDSFPPFFIAMGLTELPTKETLTGFLRSTVKESEEVGYSRMPLTQGDLLALRKMREPEVEVARGVVSGLATKKNAWASFSLDGGLGEDCRGW